jgi:hypothetical protein
MEERLCEHLPELSGEADSSVRYRTQEQEYWLFGQAGHIVRLRYCPVCGSKLPLVKGSDRFYEKSPTEAAELANRFSSIATVEAALTQIGPPDVDRGPFQDYRYPAGIKTRVGYKRALFYSRLAKTIKVAVIEWPDGRVTVNYYPKEKAQN